MHTPKNYFHDRLVLLMLSINAFLTVAGIFLILYRLDSGQGGAYVAQYRANFGVSSFRTGSIVDILAFIIFLLVTFGFQTTLSIKMYAHHRNYALTLLGLGTFLSVIAIIVSSALLVLR